MEEIQKEFVLKLGELGMSSERAFETSVTFLLSYTNSRSEKDISEEEYSLLIEEFLKRLKESN